MPDQFQGTVVKCARCGGDHLPMTFKKFTNPPQLYPYTHFALCPATGEPILLVETDEEAPNNIQVT